jgi:amino acid transporter
VYTLLCSGSVSELATMLPRAGGSYVYSERAFGERLGFVGDWMNQVVGIAFVAVAWESLRPSSIPCCHRMRLRLR